jgi:prophage regulatory protein
MSSLDDAIRSIVREELKAINPTLEALTAKAEKGGMNVALKEKRFFLRRPEVLKMVGLKTTMLYALIKAGNFPAPIKINAVSLWSLEDVEKWAEGVKNRNLSQPK